MKKCKLLILMALVWSMTACGNATYQNIGYEEAVALLEKDGTVLVDVREIAEYEQGHIEDAVNIPLTTIKKIEKYDKDQIIIVYCQSGNRSKKAAQQLIEMGYTQVYDLGSINNWR